MRLLIAVIILSIQFPASIMAQIGPPGRGGPPGSGDPADLPITVLELDGSDLDFGQIIANSGLHIIDINNSKVLGITAVRFLDVLVEITAGDALLLNNDPSCNSDPTCRLPFTLDAAYANNGENDPSAATPFTISGNTAIASFRIKQGGGNNIPPPAFGDPDKFAETAYVYIFGSITAGSVTGGIYTNTINITVVHD